MKDMKGLCKDIS